MNNLLNKFTSILNSFHTKSKSLENELENLNISQYEYEIINNKLSAINNIVSCPSNLLFMIAYHFATEDGRIENINEKSITLSGNGTNIIIENNNSYKLLEQSEFDIYTSYIGYNGFNNLKSTNQVSFTLENIQLNNLFNVYIRVTISNIKDSYISNCKFQYLSKLTIDYISYIFIGSGDLPSTIISNNTNQTLLNLNDCCANLITYDNVLFNSIQDIIVDGSFNNCSFSNLPFLKMSVFKLINSTFQNCTADIIIINDLSNCNFINCEYVSIIIYPEIYATLHFIDYQSSEELESKILTKLNNNNTGLTSDMCTFVYN